MHKPRFIFYLLCIAALFIVGCAQVVAPTGGPKDTTPPKALDFSPANKSVHFTGHKIEITFDEYIQLKDITTQLITSPPLKHQPLAIMKGKVLEITFKDTLQDNTTYTFNFGNSITDNNEGNVLKNFQYVFSTGDFLDSISISGYVMDAFLHTPEKSAFVMLYSDLSDSAPYKKPPAYVGLTDDQGHYKIENIKVGQYALITLSKSQAGYLYTPYSEQIGFHTHILNLTKNDTVNVSDFMEQEPKLKMNKARATGKGEITIVFNKPADSIRIVPINLAPLASPPFTFMKYSVTHDTLQYWTNIPDLDSMRFVVYKNKTVLDTGFAHSFPGTVAKDVKKKPKPPKVIFSSNMFRSGGFDFHYPVMLNFPVPIQSFNLSKIRFTQGKDTVKLSADTSKLPILLSLAPSKKFISDSTYRLYLLPGAFTNIFGGTNDTTDLHFTVLDQNYFGTLKLNAMVEREGHYLVQLLDDKGNVSAQYAITNSTSVFFDAIAPGVYSLRVIRDDNNNGHWDTGNYLLGVQPEKVYYFPQPITIRSNWDLTQTWQVN